MVESLYFLTWSIPLEGFKQKRERWYEIHLSLFSSFIWNGFRPTDNLSCNGDLIVRAGGVVEGSSLVLILDT